MNEPILEYTRDNFLISTDKSKIDVALIHSFLKSSYWAQNVPRAIVEKSITNALCFGIYAEGKQIGFARVITDSATFAYLADVFVVEEFRGQGLSKWLMECIIEHPELQGLRRWVLVTLDAHELYTKFGFTPLANPERFMERHFPKIYQ